MPRCYCLNCTYHAIRAAIEYANRAIVIAKNDQTIIEETKRQAFHSINKIIFDIGQHNRYVPLEVLGRCVCSHDKNEHAERYNGCTKCKCGRTYTILPPASKIVDMPKAGARGCWVVFYSDRSGASVFETELDALRVAANLTSVGVKFVLYGEEIFKDI